MENAGKAVADVVLRDHSSLGNERIACFCGRGNNGGDGFVASRYLAENKPLSLVVFVLGSEKIKLGSARENFQTIKEMGADLWCLVFVNNGVKLTITESEVLDDIKELADSGVHILVCGICLMHFNILEDKQVGETTNMLDIVTAMQLADKVINI